MGTELQYSLNPLTILLKNSNDTFTIGFNVLDTQFSSNRQLKTGIFSDLDLLLRAMDKPLEELNREYVKKTILKHEEIFKQQVQELHRLYRVQKILMCELRSMEMNIHTLTNTTLGVRETKNRLWNSTSTSEASNCSHVSNKNQSTIPCSKDHLRMNIGFDHERPFREDAAITRDHLKEKMSMGDPNLWAHGDCEVELTLSIGCGASKSKSTHGLRFDDELGCSNSTSFESRQRVSSMPVQSDREEAGGASTSSSRENVQGPPWLIQALSLKKT